MALKVKEIEALYIGDNDKTVFAQAFPIFEGLNQAKGDDFRVVGYQILGQKGKKIKVKFEIQGNEELFKGNVLGLYPDRFQFL